MQKLPAARSDHSQQIPVLVGHNRGNDPNPGPAQALNTAQEHQTAFDFPSHPTDSPNHYPGFKPSKMAGLEGQVLTINRGEQDEDRASGEEDSRTIWGFGG